MELSISITIGIVLACLVIGYYGRYILDKFRLKTVENERNKLLELANKEIENKKKEMLLEGKDKLLKERQEGEKELKEQRQELKRLNRRLSDREEAFIRTRNKGEKDLKIKEEELNNLRIEIEKRDLELKDAELACEKKLEVVSNYTKEQAKQKLIESIKKEAQKDAEKYVSKIENEAKERAEYEARRITITTIQRLAPKASQEASVSSVSLPNNEMKGRIIGKEGRNIRTLEVLTGVDIIIDDTPEAIVLSCFDPVRREKARRTITKLISDGRIHPSRIEEVYDQVSKELDKTIKEDGERTCLELGIYDMTLELKEYVGRLRYRYSYGQNILIHSKEVATICGYIASEVGANKRLAIRGGLLHDIGKGVHTEDGDHASAGASIAKQYGEDPVIINAIESHHFDVEPKYPESVIVQTADAISASRPGARRATFGDYVKRLENLETIAYGFSGVDKAFAIQAGRELRIIVNNTTTDDVQAKQVARNIAKKIEEDMKFPGQVKVSLIRETRITEYAK